MSTTSAPSTPTPTSSTNWLVPKLRSLHLASLTYNDFPIDAFLTFLRKRAASPSAATIEKIVLEDVSHVTDFNIEQLKSEVETVEVVKTAAAPMSFPFLPIVGRGGPPGGAAGLGPIESPAAAMHPIILPPVAYGAPLITPPPVDGDHRMEPITLGTDIREQSPPRRRRTRGHNIRRSRTRSPVIPDGVRYHSRSRSRSPSPIIIGERRRTVPTIVIGSSSQQRRSRSRSPRHIVVPPTTDEGSSASDMYRYRSRSPSASSRYSHRRRSLTPPPMRQRYGGSLSPAVPTVVMDSSRSRSSGSQSTHLRLGITHNSSAPLSSNPSEGSPINIEQDDFEEIVVQNEGLPEHIELDQEEEIPDMLRQSTIIIRSPTSSFSISPRRHSRGRSLTRLVPETATPSRRRSLLPSMSSRSSTARSSTHSRSPSRDDEEEPGHYGPPVPLTLPEIDSQLDFDMVEHPLVRPRQIQATVSASTDSTLPTGRDQTAFMVRNRAMSVDHRPFPHGPVDFPGQQQQHQRSMHPRNRSFGTPTNDLRLFVPVNVPPHSPNARLAATLPMRRQYASPNNTTTIVHNMIPSNLNDRETQRTSITISPSPRLRGEDSAQLKDNSSKRRGSLWSRLRNLVK